MTTRPPCDAHACRLTALYAVWYTPTGTPCHYCRAHFKDVSIKLLSRAKFIGDDAQINDAGQTGSRF